MLDHITSVGEMDKEKLARILGDKLVEIRWWPWKGEKKKIGFDYYNVSGKLIVSILNIDDKKFYLPLYIDEKPLDIIPISRQFKVDDKYLYEAEFSVKYLEDLKIIPEVEIEVYNDIGSPPKSAAPLSLESTNIVVKYTFLDGSDLVLKSYRLLPDVDIEPRIIAKLSREQYKYIPRLYRIYKLNGRVVSILMEYVEGHGDGGYPFYLACKEYIMKHPGSSGYRTGLAAKLGDIIAELHLKLNKPGDKGFFGIEEVTEKDIETWMKRIEKRYREINILLEKYVSRLDRKHDINKAEFWRQLFDEKVARIIEITQGYLELYRGRAKARIHQDLHLAQMIYREPSDFIITDFEGEPGRTIEERLMKEPPLRDIASMIRSFQYLSFMAYLEVKGGTIHSVARKLLKHDATWEWRMRHSLSMVLSYVARTAGTHLHGIPRDMLIAQYNNFLLPWIVERALYEIYYEASYRPEWVPVPLIGLLNPSIPSYQHIR